jgi:hypothetical protein
VRVRAAFKILPMLDARCGGSTDPNSLHTFSLEKDGCRFPEGGRHSKILFVASRNFIAIVGGGYRHMALSSRPFTESSPSSPAAAAAESY